MADGLLFYLIPQKRLTPRIARVLSAYIDDPQVRKFLDGQFKAFGQVMIAGLKRLRPRVNDAAFHRLQEAATNDLPEMAPGEFSFPVPTVSKDFFIRSSEIIPEELAEELLTSPLWKDPALGALVENDETKTVIRPLMPPRKAHLAMLIAAGLINNQVLEAQGQQLLIKGTSKKVTDRSEEKTEKGIKITEKERIVTQINAFDLSSGEYLQIV